jgi:hypothetical protein
MDRVYALLFNINFENLCQLLGANAKNLFF